MSAKKSYGHILKSSSVVGGSAAVTLLLGMVRTKFAAVLVGSAGVGLMAGFTAIHGLIGTVSGLGIQTSAVREIAAAIALGDEQNIGRLVLTLRRLCWLTGLVGMAAMMAFSPLLSRLTFDSEAYALDISALGIVILLTNLAGGHLALLQGMRCINDLARANIGSAIFATLFAMGFYSWLGLRGIVPLLVSIAAMQLTISWYFGRRIPVPSVTLSWRQSFVLANGMLKLGLVFMWSSLLVCVVSYITITLITRWINLHAVGIYSAAFMLSGIYVNFMLGAMGADYYPRLIGVADDKAAVNRLANEQTEIGLLLALPGLLATLALAPWILKIFYTREFIDAVELLQWFVLGCLGRLISWPLGFVILALGKGRWFLFTETSFHLVHAALVAIFLKCLGIEGVAIAFFVAYLAYIAIVYFVCHRLTGFSWSSACREIAWYMVPVTGVMFAVCRNLPVWSSTLVGIALTFVLGVFCIRELVRRVEPAHFVLRLIFRLPSLEAILIPRATTDRLRAKE